MPKKHPIPSHSGTYDFVDVPYWSEGSNSVVERINSREQFKKLVPEIVCLCCEAARRKELRKNPGATMFDKPLSEAYIKERIKWDENLRGFTVRTNDSRRMLQGFIMYSKFSTWQWSFRWDSTSPQSGIRACDRKLHNIDDGSLTFRLANEIRHRLEARVTMKPEISSKKKQKRKRRKNKTTSPYCGKLEGVGWPRLTELSLLGALGCGEILCRFAMRDVLTDSTQRCVVLQATKLAVPFYERMGFVRVGAVVRVGDRAVMPEVPYRHWVYSKRWDNGDMSYMMALDLTKTSRLVETPIVVPTLELQDLESKRQREETMREARREMKKMQEEELERKRVEALKKIEEQRIQKEKAMLEIRRLEEERRQKLLAEMERAQKEKEAEMLKKSSSVCPPVPSIKENEKKVVVAPAVRVVRVFREKMTLHTRAHTHTHTHTHENITHTHQRSNRHPD